MSNRQEQNDEVGYDIADGGGKLKNPVFHTMAFDRVVPIGLDWNTLAYSANGTH